MNTKSRYLKIHSMLLNMFVIVSFPVTINTVCEIK